jgi:hypothetical protein
MSENKSDPNFMVRVAARFLKDPAISSDAKALRAVLGAYADGHTGASYVLPSTLEETLGWGRRRREAAQRELCGADGCAWAGSAGRARGGRGASIFCPFDRCAFWPQRRNRATYH